jgi:hypothetical protein
MGKVEINQESLIKLLNQVEENIQEERGLALERYKRQEENLDDSPEGFALQGKNLIDLLKVAAERSNTLLNMSRMIASIVYKDTAMNNSSDLSDDEIKAEIKRQIQSEMDDDSLDIPVPSE